MSVFSCRGRCFLPMSLTTARRRAEATALVRKSKTSAPGGGTLSAVHSARRSEPACTGSGGVLAVRCSGCDASCWLLSKSSNCSLQTAGYCDECFFLVDLPTCLLCVCLSKSVYCEEVNPDMTTVPPLPKETAYLYARFNKIKKISKKDFSDTGRSDDWWGPVTSYLCQIVPSHLTQLLIFSITMVQNRFRFAPMHLPQTQRCMHKLLSKRASFHNQF